MKSIANIHPYLLVLFICGLVSMSSPLWAQVDEERMQRDLEISKNILATLLKEEGNRHTSGHGIEASYVEDFGVIFTISGRGMFFNFDFGEREVVLPGDDAFHISEDSEFTFEEETTMEYRNDEKEGGVEEDVEDKGKEKRNVPRQEDRTVVKRYSYAQSDGKEEELYNEKLEGIITTFLADYADLIGQLGPEDKIMVKRKDGSDNFAVISWSDAAGTEISQASGTGMSVTVEKKDITSYKSGKIDREEFEGRLIIEKEIKKEKKADLEIFGNAFRQYFSPEYSKTFFTNTAPGYELLKGLGVVFHARTYSSFKEKDMYFLPATGVRVNDEERNEKVETIYPEFVQDVKAFIVDYGRTIRSLIPDEKLVMKIELTKCGSCEIPKAVEATVPISTLINYDQQKISREKALAGVAIKEVK